MQSAVNNNRRRVKGDRGKWLMKMRGELTKRSFAHCYYTGGMRRAHLREYKNILKRPLIHAAGLSLRLFLRKILGFCPSRSLQGMLVRVFLIIPRP